MDVDCKVEQNGDAGTNHNFDMLNCTYEERLAFSNAISQPMAGKKLVKKILKLLGQAVERKLIIMSAKDVVKKIMKKQMKGLVLLAADTYPIDCISHIPAICEEFGIPYCYVPLAAEIGSGMQKNTGSMCVLVQPHEEYQELYNYCYEHIDALPIPSL